MTTPKREEPPFVSDEQLLPREVGPCWHNGSIEDPGYRPEHGLVFGVTTVPGLSAKHVRDIYEAELSRLRTEQEGGPLKPGEWACHKVSGSVWRVFGANGSFVWFTENGEGVGQQQFRRATIDEVLAEQEEKVAKSLREIHAMLTGRPRAREHMERILAKNGIEL